MDGDLFSDDISDLENIAKKYVIPEYADDWLAAMNLPMTPEQMRKIYVQGEKHLKTLFNSLLAFDKNNIYGNYGMFIMETFTGTIENAIKYAQRGINENPDHCDVFDLRTQLAEYYEKLEMFREANGMYIDNINSALGNMKHCIYDFFRKEQTKLASTQFGLDIKLVEDRDKTPFGTYIRAEKLSDFPSQTQNEAQREEFARAKKIHESRSYDEANDILRELNHEFGEHELNLYDGIENLSEKLNKTFMTRMN